MACGGQHSRQHEDMLRTARGEGRETLADAWPREFEIAECHVMLRQPGGEAGRRPCAFGDRVPIAAAMAADHHRRFHRPSLCACLTVRLRPILPYVSALRI